MNFHERNVLQPLMARIARCRQIVMFRIRFFAIFCENGDAFHKCVRNGRANKGVCKLPSRWRLCTNQGGSRRVGLAPPNKMRLPLHCAIGCALAHRSRACRKHSARNPGVRITNTP